MNNPIKIECLFDAPIAKVWNALTAPAEMKNWYFDLPDFKPEVGCKFEFGGGPSPDKQYLHLCEVAEVIAGKRLTHSWRYDGYAGNSFVTFELSKQDGKTLLKFLHAGVDSFPESNPDLALENFVSGWNHIINISLKNYLEKV
jgi:uncharacterized protein YndB with AHSA1/START domain